MHYLYRFAVGLLLMSAAAVAQAQHAPPLRTHMISAGVRVGNGGVVMPLQYTMGYEWQLGRRLSFLTGFAYSQKRNEGTVQTILYGRGVIDDHSIEKRHLSSLTTQLRYFLESSKPALLGLYVGGGVIATYENRRMQHTDAQLKDFRVHAWRGQAALRFGRQWAIGSRLALDTFIGADAVFLEKRNEVQFDISLLGSPGYKTPKGLGELPLKTILTPTAGAALGYRF